MESTLKIITQVHIQTPTVSTTGFVLARSRQGCVPSPWLGWLTSPPAPNPGRDLLLLHTIAPLCAPHSSASPGAFPFSSAVPTSPVKAGVPAADSQQAAGQRGLRRKRCVTSRSLKRMEPRCFSELRRTCLLEIKGKIWSDVKGFSIFIHFPMFPTLSQQSSKM